MDTNRTREIKVNSTNQECKTSDEGHISYDPSGVFRFGLADEYGNISPVNTQDISEIKTTKKSVSGIKTNQPSFAYDSNNKLLLPINKENQFLVDPKGLTALQTAVNYRLTDTSYTNILESFKENNFQLNTEGLGEHLSLLFERKMFNFLNTLNKENQL